MGLALPAVDNFAESASRLTDGVPVVGNAALFVDSLCTAGRASVNFYCAPTIYAKVLFAASCGCGLMGAAASGTALVTSFAGIPATGYIGTFGARAFNRWGKYTLPYGQCY